MTFLFSDFRDGLAMYPLVLSGSPNSSIFNRSWSNDREYDTSTVEMLTSPAVEAVLDSREWNVPLLDVHPVFQRHGGAKLTATALENVR